MKLTKIKIEQMANEIMELLRREELEDDVSIYFNNKRMDADAIEDGINPKKYFKYAADNHILSMSFEGMFYSIINYNIDTVYCDKIMNKFDNILRKYGVYYELGNAWNLTCYPIKDDMEIEYTYYDENEDPIRIYDYRDKMIPLELRLIKMAWEEFQKKVGDKGSCVLGAGFEFRYDGIKFFLSSPSIYQGSISWETDKDAIQRMLEHIGAIDIKYDWGMMD